MNIVELFNVDLVLIRFLDFVPKRCLIFIMVTCRSIRNIILDRHIHCLGRKLSFSIFLYPFLRHWGSLSKDVCESAYASYLKPKGSTIEGSAKRFLHLLRTCLNYDSIAIYLCRSPITQSILKNVNWTDTRLNYLHSHIKKDLVNKTWSYLFNQLTTSRRKRICTFEL
jgi:hypothetical protein